MAIEGNPSLLNHNLLKNSLNTLDTNKNSVLHYLVRHSHLEMVKSLVQLEDIIVDVPGCDGMTPLHYASR